MYLFGGFFEVFQSVFTGNVATHGGGILASAVTGTVSRTVLHENSAHGTMDSEYHILYPGKGGGISLGATEAGASIANNTFVGNLAEDYQYGEPGDGAAVFFSGNGTCYNNIVSENSGGPAIALRSQGLRWGYQLFYENLDGEYSGIGFLKPVDLIGDPRFVTREEGDFRILA